MKKNVENFSKEKLIFIEGLRRISFIENNNTSCIIPPPTLNIDLKKTNFKVELHNYFIVETILSALNSIYIFEDLSESNQLEFYFFTKKVVDQSFELLETSKEMREIITKYDNQAHTDEYTFYDNDDAKYIKNVYCKLYNWLKKRNMIFDSSVAYKGTEEIISSNNVSIDRISILYSLVCFSDAATDISLSNKISKETLEMMSLTNIYLAKLGVNFLPSRITT